MKTTDRVINAYSRRGEPASGKKIKCILDKIEKVQLQMSAQPMIISITRFMLNAYTKFREPGAADWGEALLHRMEEGFRHGCISHDMVLNVWARQASATWSKGDKISVVIQPASFLCFRII